VHFPHPAVLLHVAFSRIPIFHLALIPHFYATCPANNQIFPTSGVYQCFVSLHNYVNSAKHDVSTHVHSHNNISNGKSLFSHLNVRLVVQKSYGCFSWERGAGVNPTLKIRACCSLPVLLGCQHQHLSGPGMPTVPTHV